MPLVSLWRAPTVVEQQASAHHKGIGGVIRKLLVLNDVAAAIEHSTRHRVNDAGLICTLQGSDEIHAQSLKGTSE